jgi:hypothetical protein
MTIKTAAARVGNGLLGAATVLHNSGLSTRNHEIDTELEVLQARMDVLKEERANNESAKISYR